MAYPQNEVIVPVVNWNGTEAEDLIKGYIKVMDAINATIDALKAATPHGRDYQTEAASVFEEARVQHSDRLHILAVMLQDIESIALNVLDQKRGKR
jgi:hypothetical protein